MLRLVCPRAERQLQLEHAVTHFCSSCLEGMKRRLGSGAPMMGMFWGSRVNLRRWVGLQHSRAVVGVSAAPPPFLHCSPAGVLAGAALPVLSAWARAGAGLGLQLGAGQVHVQGGVARREGRQVVGGLVREGSLPGPPLIQHDQSQPEPGLRPHAPAALWWGPPNKQVLASSGTSTTAPGAHKGAPPKAWHAPVHVRLVGIDLHVREVALADGHDHAQLLPAQHHLLVVVLVVDGALRLRRWVVWFRMGAHFQCPPMPPPARLRTGRQCARRSARGHAHLVLEIDTRADAGARQGRGVPCEWRRRAP